MVVAHSHGEDKLGPHGGFIKMPGAYHVEVVPAGSDKLKVFLLDMDWKNPVVDNSQLKIEYVNKVAMGVNTHSYAHTLSAKLLTCNVQKNYYLCQLPQGADLKSTDSELSVESTRKGQKGLKVAYSLPLKLADKVAEKMEKMEDKKSENKSDKKSEKKEDPHHHH